MWEDDLRNRMGPRPDQFSTVNSVTIPYALMVQFCCICGAKIVHASQNPSIPRSGCRFDLWNPAFQPRTRRRSDLAAVRRLVVNLQGDKLLFRRRLLKAAQVPECRLEIIANAVKLAKTL